MPTDYLTRRVARLKLHLGIDQKRPATVALENEALRLFREMLAGEVGKVATHNPLDGAGRSSGCPQHPTPPLGLWSDGRPATNRLRRPRR